MLREHAILHVVGAIITNNTRNSCS